MGNTPLAWAVGNGHEAIVKLLLGQDDIAPNKLDKEGRTPLFLAACNGHEGVVKILLGRDDVDPNKSDRYDRNATLVGCLRWARRSGENTARTRRRQPQ